MRILFVSECYPSQGAPQYGIFIRQQAQALANLNNTVEVLVPTVGKVNGTPIFSDGAYRVTYRRGRYNVCPLWTGRPVYRWITALLEEKHYDLVAVHITGDAMLKMMVWACNHLNIPVVVHYHGLNVWEEYTTVHPLRQKLYAARRRCILKRTQGVVGVSDKVSDIVCSRLSGVPVRTVYNGVDLNMFSGAQPKPGRFRVIAVGNLIPTKGFSVLLDAFAEFLEQVPHATLEIIGDGVQRKALEQQMACLDLNAAVHFHGKLPYEQVAQEMAQSDLFVLPSIYEALGCVYLEAMGCGLPTIGVQGMGIDEVICHGENGLLVRPSDSADLCEKMLCVAQDPELAQKLSRNGRRTAERFTWAASAQALNSFYEECKKV